MPGLSLRHLRESTRRACILLLAATAVVASGCRTLMPADEADTKASRPHVQHFDLEGRISATDGERGANGSLLWSHRPDRDEWTLLSPLGQIVARLSRDPSGARLDTGDGRPVFAESVDAMLPELLGVPAPVDGLAYWVQASVRPGARILAFDGVGRPARITDAGWIIDYLAYADGEPDAPPRRIEAVWGEARIRLVIDHWSGAQ